MSSSILDQLEAKPVPKKQQQIHILVPYEGQVDIKAPLLDLRDEGYDRQALKKRLKSKGILIGLPTDTTRPPSTVPTLASTKSAPPLKVKKLRKRLRIAKKPGGTITALTKPATGPIKIQKRSRKLNSAF